MIILHRALGIYRIIIIAWAIMTWIPGLSGSMFHYYVGLPVRPVLNLFSFATVGFVGLQAIILLGIIWGLEVMIEKHLQSQGVDVYESGEQERDDEENQPPPEFM